MSVWVMQPKDLEISFDPKSFSLFTAIEYCGIREAFDPKLHTIYE